MTFPLVATTQLSRPISCNYWEIKCICRFRSNTRPFGCPRRPRACRAYRGSRFLNRTVEWQSFIHLMHADTGTNLKLAWLHNPRIAWTRIIASYSFIRRDLSRREMFWAKGTVFWKMMSVPMLPGPYVLYVLFFRRFRTWTRTTPDVQMNNFQTKMVTTTGDENDQRY